MADEPKPPEGKPTVSFKPPTALELQVGEILVLCRTTAKAVIEFDERLTTLEKWVEEEGKTIKEHVETRLNQHSDRAKQIVYQTSAGDLQNQVSISKETNDRLRFEKDVREKLGQLDTKIGTVTDGQTQQLVGEIGRAVDAVQKSPLGKILITALTTAILTWLAAHGYANVKSASPAPAPTVMPAGPVVDAGTEKR